jgi:uncharacterized protein YkwD
VSTPPKLLAAIPLALSSLLLCLTPAPALAGPGKAAGRSSHLQRSHARRHAKRAERVRCSLRRHPECGAGPGGTPAGAHKKKPHAADPTASKPALAKPLRKTKSELARESGAATIAAVLATPCQNTELVPGSDNLTTVRAAVLCLINRTRAEHSESPLLANAQLEEAAESHCQELIADDYFAHVSPSGETPVDRIEKTGYVPGPSVGYVIGENLAWGTYGLATPQSIVAAWIASPGHLANILESQYRETGIAITPAIPESLGEGNPGATYAQEFGVIIH